jgi:hypothetical protein
MTHVLVQYEDNYADEFDIEGFMVMTAADWTQHTREAENADWPQEKYFGTNEYTSYYSAKDYLDCFTVTPLNDVEYVTVTTLFEDIESYGIGMFQTIEFEDEEWDDDED